MAFPGSSGSITARHIPDFIANTRLFRVEFDRTAIRFVCIGGPRTYGIPGLIESWTRSGNEHNRNKPLNRGTDRSGENFNAEVEAKVLFAARRVGPFDDDRLDRCFEQLLVHYVGSGNHHREWSSVLLDQDRLLGAVLGAVGRVLPYVFPAKSSFAQSAVCCLPPPIDDSELVAFAQQDGPDLLEDSVATPPLEPTMDIVSPIGLSNMDERGPC